MAPEKSMGTKILFEATESFVAIRVLRNKVPRSKQQVKPNMTKDLETN